jgi:hypothetical protein
LRDQHLVGDWYPPLAPRVVEQIRPLAFEYARWVWDNVFVTVKHPFDPRKATGWMAKVFKSRERQEKLGTTTGRALKDVLLDEFKWAPDAKVIVLHAPEHGYLTTVDVFLEHSERFFRYFDNGVVCHPTDQNVVVYWDTTGPYFGTRRDRCLTNG